jgi:hypothetical protein
MACCAARAGPRGPPRASMVLACDTHTVFRKRPGCADRRHVGITEKAGVNLTPGPARTIAGIEACRNKWPSNSRHAPCAA